MDLPGRVRVAIVMFLVGSISCAMLFCGKWMAACGAATRSQNEPGLDVRGTLIDLVIATLVSAGSWR